MGTSVLESNIEQALNPFHGIIQMISKFWIVFIVLGIIVLISMFQIFRKAGKPGWASLVPIYNIFVLFQICEIPWTNFFWGFVPLLGPIILWVLIVMNLSRVFGKSKEFGTLMIFVPFICFPMIAFQTAEYKNNAPTKALDTTTQGIAFRGMNQVDGMQLKNNSEFVTISKEDPAMRNVQAVRVQDQSTDVTTSNPQRDLLNTTPTTNINVAQMAVQGTPVTMTPQQTQSTIEPVTNLKPVSIAPYEASVQQIPEAPIQQGYSSSFDMPVPKEQFPIDSVAPIEPTISVETKVEDEMMYNPQMAILNGSAVQEPVISNIEPVMQPSDIENMTQSPMNIFQTPQIPVEPTPFSTPQSNFPNQQTVPTPAMNLNGNMIQPSQQELRNKQSEITDGFKRCPKCGAKVAAHLETCFLCGERF